MIRRDIRRSKKIASLSKEAALLFVMMIPHYSAHGKMNGSPYYIKGEAVPLLDYFTIPLIKKCLKEITLKTNVKWYEFEGFQYVQSLSWKNHQTLRENRLGLDELPSFPGNVQTTPGCIPPEVEVEVELEVKGKEEEEGKKPKSFTPPTLEQVTEYAKLRNSSVNPVRFYEYFTAGNWSDSKGNKVKNWKQKFLTWEGHSDKQNQNNGSSGDEWNGAYEPLD
jgi:hypothetical protein